MRELNVMLQLTKSQEKKEMQQVIESTAAIRKYVKTLCSRQEEERCDDEAREIINRVM